jgi:methylglutaconyl-CoA hydratase
VWNRVGVSEQVLQIARDGIRATVTMARPEVRNAFNAALIAALRDAFTALSDEPAIRYIVLAGAGKTFSGGADINWMRGALDLSEDDNVRSAEQMAAMYRAIDRCPKPVISRVQGAAVGGGLGLCAVSDIAVAAADAVFGFTEVKLGILPAVIAPFAVAKIGVSHARALFVTGERFDAQRAAAIGLVHHVVAPDGLDAKIDAIGAEFATAGPNAVASAKAIIPAVSGITSDEATPITTRAIARARTSAEGQEGLRAFLERREPSWRGR